MILEKRGRLEEISRTPLLPLRGSSVSGICMYVCKCVLYVELNKVENLLMKFDSFVSSDGLLTVLLKIVPRIHRIPSSFGTTPASFET
jgi:hypothetical protein